MECMSKCNMRSATFVEFCVLSREDFIDVLSQEAYTEDRKLIEEIILSKYQDDHHSDWALHTPLMRQKANVFEQPLNPLSQMQNQVKRIEQLTQALLVKLDDSTEEAKKGVSPTSHSFLTGQMSTSGSSSGRINSCSSSSSNGSGSNSNSSCSSSSLLLPRLSENTPTKNSINGGLVARATGRSQMSRYIEPISGDQNTSDEDDDEGGSS